MPSSVILLLELGLLLAGLFALWKFGLSPEARRQPARLATWDATPSDFILFLWVVLVCGLAAQYGFAVYVRHHPLGLGALTIIGTAVFHGGLMLGLAGFRVFFPRAATGVVYSLSRALGPGVVTFLIAIPVLAAVSLLWQGLLDLCHIKAGDQESIDLLRTIRSPGLRFLLLSAAILFAPITEELIFRGGIFRYARTRLPRWAALLVPALLFASLHLNLASFVPLVVLALIFSLAYERTGNIATTILAHALFNLNTSLLVLFGVNV